MQVERHWEQGRAKKDAVGQVRGETQTGDEQREYREHKRKYKRK